MIGVGLGRSTVAAVFVVNLGRRAAAAAASGSISLGGLAIFVSTALLRAGALARLVGPHLKRGLPICGLKLCVLCAALRVAFVCGNLSQSVRSHDSCVRARILAIAIANHTINRCTI